MTKDNLIKNKRGKIVSKAQSAMGNNIYKNISPWTTALLLARKNIAHENKFIPCGGQTALGKKLFVFTLFFYNMRESPRDRFSSIVYASHMAGE